MPQPQWLDWVQRLQSLSQVGLQYAQNEFDRDRYQQIRQIAAEIAATQTNIPVGEVQAIFDSQTGYLTPKVDARAVVFREGKLLMVRETLDGGRWTLPGGWADVGEPPSLATEREVMEEAGYRVRAVKLLALYDRAKHDHPPMLFYTYKMIFRCELLSDEQNLKPNVETSEAGWFAEHELPQDLSIARVTPAQLRRFFEHYHQPDLPTDFD